jgi:type IV secretory pathway TrbD component
MNDLVTRAAANWKTTLAGILLAAVAVAKAVQAAGHDPYAIIIAVSTALLGVLAKD